MAGCSKQFEFVFDGGLQSHTRALLVNEVIKHLLYERNQIPLQFDSLKQQFLKTALSEQDGGRKPLSAHNQLEWKARSLISSLDSIFTSVEKAFETCPEIQKMAVLLGSTPATPKECYIINLPHLCPEADNISLKTSKQALFQHLVAEQVLSSDFPLGPTNLYVILCAPRNVSVLPGFVPKTSFKVPSRGHCLTLNIHCRQPNFLSQDLTFEDTEVEISGIEPLPLESSVNSPMAKAQCLKFSALDLDATLPFLTDQRTPEKVQLPYQFQRKRELSSSDKDFEVHLLTPLTGSTPKVPNSQHPMPADAMYSSTPAHGLLNPAQYVWFQCATVVKGYKL